MEGFLRELDHTVADPIAYHAVFDQGNLPLNALLGQQIELRFLGEKRCIVCNRKVNKLYQGGYCYPCVTTLAQTDLCIVKPHECHFHLGTCRDATYGESHCMIPHYVYLAVSSQAKVGLTRKGREYKRWVDQGAHKAMLFAEVPTRKAAGQLEMMIASFIPDKTQWRHLVVGKTADVDLLALAKEIQEQLPESVRPSLLVDQVVHTFHYPVLDQAVPKVRSLDLEKESLHDRFIGIRGQYMLFDSAVVNIKKHGGMKCAIFT